MDIINNYNKPTPSLVKRIADALLVAVLALQAQPDLLGANGTRYVAMGVIIAKLLTNVFKQKDEGEKAL